MNPSFAIHDINLQRWHDWPKLLFVHDPAIFWRIVEDGNRHEVRWCQVDAIAAAEGIDVLFIGRIDLTIAQGCTPSDAPAVLAAVDLILAAYRRVGRA